MKHQFTIDPDGEGWLIECSCGWFAHGMTETEALNHFGEHEEATLKVEIVERFMAGDSCEAIALYNPKPEQGVRERTHTLRRKNGMQVEQVLRDYMNGKFTLATKKRP